MLTTILMTFILIRKVEAPKRKEIVCSIMFFFFSWLWDCVTNSAITKTTRSSLFKCKNCIYCYDGLQTQIHLYAENIFFSFYAKWFSCAFTNGFLPGISLPGTVFYHNTCFLVCHAFLLTTAIRTSLLSDWQLLLLSSNSIFKYEIRVRWLPNN